MVALEEAFAFLLQLAGLSWRVHAATFRMADWNPGLYLKFERERTQPVRDLVARLEVQAPARILDLGCGPGNSTSVLKDRWPGASVIGLDSSAAMLEKARRSRQDIEWVQVDAGTDLSHLGVFDIVLANASLQWLPEHHVLIPGLFKRVTPGGALAIQIPQFDEMPIARVLNEVSKQLAYATFFTDFDAGLHRLNEAGYYEVLCDESRALDLWVTHYYHVLENQPAIVEWMKSTAMRPYLDCLPQERHQDFAAEVLERVKAIYPVQRDGKVLFIFKRLFFIAYKL